jgi:hypothetical protein
MNATPCPPMPDADGASHGRAPGEKWRESDGIHVEVRGLAPPGPLVAIVRLVESVSDATPVIVHHDRDPQLLYGELADRGWIATRIEGEPGEFRLRLERGK